MSLGFSPGDAKALAQLVDAPERLSPWPLILARVNKPPAMPAQEPALREIQLEHAPPAASPRTEEIEVPGAGPVRHPENRNDLGPARRLLRSSTIRTAD